MKKLTFHITVITFPVWMNGKVIVEEYATAQILC
jgi:hypothetical protein